MQDFAIKFKPGDVVRLKSGGPAMTVACCENGEGKLVICDWFDGITIRQKAFANEQLELNDLNGGYHPIPEHARIIHWLICYN